MGSKSFNEIIEKVLEHEGGYVDDPADKGGTTNFGVIQRTYQNYIDKQCSELIRVELNQHQLPLLATYDAHR